MVDGGALDQGRPDFTADFNLSTKTAGDHGAGEVLVSVVGEGGGVHVRSTISSSCLEYLTVNTGCDPDTEVVVGAETGSTGRVNLCLLLACIFIPFSVSLSKSHLVHVIMAGPCCMGVGQFTTCWYRDGSSSSENSLPYPRPACSKIFDFLSFFGKGYRVTLTL